MKKNKSENIIKEIDEAIFREEMAIPIYTKHLETALFWSGISSGKKEKITKMLKTLRAQSRGHIKLLKKIRVIAKKGKQHVSKKRLS